MLSAGVIFSPHLLVLSGVGDRDLLQQLGIPLILHSPGVGLRVHDHIGMNSAPMPFKIRDTANFPRNPSPLFDFRTEARRFMNDATPNMLSVGGSTLYVRLTTSDDLIQPDAWMSIRSDTGLTVNTQLSNIKSRGQLIFNQDNPESSPTYIHTFSESDLDRMVTFVRKVVNIFHSPENSCSSNFFLDPQDYPWNDEARLRDFLKIHMQSHTHATSSAHMGVEGDPRAVIDPRLRLIGVDGLRVVDASSLPTSPLGNIGAVVLMLAAKGSDLIIEDWSTRK